MKNKIVLPVMILCLAVLGCSKIKELADRSNSSSTNTDNPASNSGPSTGTTTANSGEPKADIIAASKKFIALPAFSATMDGTGTNAIHSKVEYAAPDRFHISYLGGTGAGMEMIMIGKQTYMKNAGSGNWNKSPVNLGESIPSLRDSFTDEGLKTLDDAKFDGDDTIDGKPALVYSYKNVTPKGGFPFHSKIWIGKNTGLPMKIEVNYENGTLKQMTINYDTDSPVTIEAPVK
ncbi:MAG: hypothetical protein ABJA02_00545 [Acidobacteriota bacterium]